MTRKTEEERQANKYVTFYLSEDYLAPFNKILKDYELGRNEFVRSLVLAEMVTMGYIDALEVRRRDRDNVGKFMDDSPWENTST